MNILTKCPLGSHVFQAKVTIFELIQDIIGTNVLTKFHEDRKINVASRVLTRKNAPPPGGYFHEDQTINVASRVKNAPPLGSHTNLLTKFHEDWTINVASRELQAFQQHLGNKRAKMALFHDPRQNCPPHSSHAIQLTGTIFKLNSRIKETNVLGKFHENWAKNVNSTTDQQTGQKQYVPHYYSGGHKNAPPTGGHKNAPPTGRPCFFTDLDHFRTRLRHQMNQLFTRKTAPPTGGHVFQRIGTTFELNQETLRQTF
ncbi:hypothetical protein DPMN_189288 [Dreissena polymorpha]|uniref:Uncharacterized protein n=1 Tax=Dreissena polymorpha TaxID=45954 RepID=A0A9D4DT98_DREPO|nr:hypothetical protein DPMN_189288 [Dreissena polymorpha]